MMRFFLICSALTLAALSLAGCPESMPQEAGPVDTCVKAAEQCRLGGGLIGVCFENIHGVLECRAQH